MTVPADLRPALRVAYLMAFDDFSTVETDVARTLAVEPGVARVLLRRLERDGLCCSMHVNGERALTFQCHETYDSISRTTAIRRFDKTYPKGAEVRAIPEPAKVKTGRRGATGPAYSQKQLTEAARLRREGLSWTKIAAKVGVKSEGYLAKTLKSLNLV